jgi:zinc protease
VNGLANAYGRALTSGLTLDDIHAWPDIIQSITVEEIMTAARDVFDLNSSVTGWIRK